MTEVERLLSRAEALVRLLREPNPGLHSWQVAVSACRKDIAEKSPEFVGEIKKRPIPDRAPNGHRPHEEDDDPVWEYLHRDYD